jgi:hypothetical protein
MTIQISSRVLKRQEDGVNKHELVGSVVGLKYILNKNGARRKMVLIVWDDNVDRVECLEVRYVFELKPVLSEYQKAVVKADMYKLQKSLKAERAFITSLDPELSSDIVNSALLNEDIKMALYHTYQRTILKRHICS